MNQKKKKKLVLHIFPKVNGVFDLFEKRANKIHIPTIYKQKHHTLLLLLLLGFHFPRMLGYNMSCHVTKHNPTDSEGAYHLMRKRCVSDFKLVSIPSPSRPYPLRILLICLKADTHSTFRIICMPLRRTITISLLVGILIKQIYIYIYLPKKHTQPDLIYTRSFRNLPPL